MSSSTSGQIKKTRLLQQRRIWKRNPIQGFIARPLIDASGRGNLSLWECEIPGIKNSPWEGGRYKLTMEFSDQYPNRPPKCKFQDVLFHPNIYPSGTVCLSILNQDQDWRPTITVRQILSGIQNLLDNPNIKSPAQLEPLQLFRDNRELYQKRVREQAKKHMPETFLKQKMEETKKIEQDDNHRLDKKQNKADDSKREKSDGKLKVGASVPDHGVNKNSGCESSPIVLEQDDD